MGQEKAGPAASLELIIQHNKEISKGYFLVNLFSSKDGFPEKYTKAFGFSNNVIGLFGPPSFEKAQIVVQENKRSSVSIELRN